MLTKMRQYRDNARRIRHSYNNPLKKPENVAKKDELERQFYDEEARPHLENFRDEVFLYDEDEVLPLSHRFFYSQLTELSGKRVLDVCCGYGFTSVKCAKLGARVTGIDISPNMIELTGRNARYNGVAAEVEACLMSAQEMTFPDNSFDYAVGLGALHHLNLELAGAELSRVLKTGGKAIFLEPRIPHKLLIYVRSFFPQKCLESPGGSQLTEKDIASVARYFSDYREDYFIFTAKLARFPALSKYRDTLDSFDARLVKKMPWMKKCYWAFVVQFRK